MAEKKMKFFRGVTPIGESLWTKVNEPNTRFNKEGTYEAQLVLTPKAAESLKNSIQDVFDKYYDEETDGMNPKKAAKMEQSLPWFDEEDENGDETGNIVFKFKEFAKTADGSPKALKVVDAQGQELKRVPNIGNGSKIRIAYWVKPFNSGTRIGVSLRISGVQIVDLVSYSGGGGADFDKVEGGSYVSAPPSEEGEADDDIPF